MGQQKHSISTCDDNWSFFGGKFHQKVTQLSQNKIFYYKFLLKKQSSPKNDIKLFFWGRVLSNLCFLAIVLRVLWNHATSQVEICIGMLATLATSINWKKKTLVMIWKGKYKRIIVWNCQVGDHMIDYVKSHWYTL
jgi:hypothetical protein